MLKIKVVNKGHQPLPQYATEQSAGMDLRANIDEPITLKPLERKLIPTGLQIALPVRKLIGGEKAFKRMAPSVVKEAVLREGHPPGTPLTPLLSPFLPTPPCATA